MSKIPAIKRLTKEDFPNIDAKFIDALNTILEAQYNALNKGISITDNIDGQISTVTIEKGTTISSSNPLKIAWTRRNPPATVVLGKISKSNSTLTGSTTMPGFEWEYDATNKQIKIIKVFGITNPDTSYTYTLTLECKAS